MLRTVKAVLSTEGITRPLARKMIKECIALTTARGYVPVDERVASALAQDMRGTLQTVPAPDGQIIGLICHSLKPDDIRNIKADLLAAIDGEEFSELPTKAPKAPKAIVRVEEYHAKLMGMTAGDFGKFCELNGVKATIDRGVWSLHIPGARGTVYFDAGTGERLAEGESSADAKLTIDGRKAEGKLRALAVLVAKNAKLTRSQKEFLADCAAAGVEMPKALKSLVE